MRRAVQPARLKQGPRRDESVPPLDQTAGVGPWEGAVEKSRQRRSRHFFVLTYRMYALRAKTTAALLEEPFGNTQDMLF